MNDDTILSIDDVDKLFNKQIEENRILLKEFEKYLYSTNLTKKTVNKHLDNIDFYINTYVLRTDIIPPEEATTFIDDYFDYFLPHKTTFGSVSDTKTQIGSLKKFYKYLVDINRLSKNDYDEMLEIIKENKQEWFNAYNNEDIDEDW